jgi:LETM1 and EF-hand domain-containing protein 1
MIRHACLRRGLGAVTHQNVYWLLSHKAIEDLKSQLLGVQKSTMSIKVKIFLREMKYTIIQGSKDLWADVKWFWNLKRTKPRFEYTGYELNKRKRIIIDLLKFIPYSVILVVPFAELSLPVILYLYPNAIPSVYLLDTAVDTKIKTIETIQEEAHKKLLERLLTVLRGLSMKEESFTHYDEFKKEFFEMMECLDEKLNYQSFSSEELLTLLQFMGGDYFEGTTTINKSVNFFTGIVPRWFFYKPIRFAYYKLQKKTAPPYKDPWWIMENFRVFEFNYYPFEDLKRRWLLRQINNKFVATKEEDLAFDRYGMNDVKLEQMKLFARERGLATLTCYETLRNVINNDWVKVVTHPRFTSNNARLWYSVLMYSFMEKSNRDLN